MYCIVEFIASEKFGRVIDTLKPFQFFITVRNYLLMKCDYRLKVQNEQ